jgi:hypothetical protein
MHPPNITEFQTLLSAEKTKKCIVQVSCLQRSDVEDGGM